MLTDVVLPGETGRVLAAKLRRAKAELKVLLVTGYSEEMMVPEAKNEECLRKPFSTAVLLRRIQDNCWITRLSATEEELKHACGNG